MLFFSFFVHFLICFRQLFDGKYGVGVGDQTDDCVDNSDHSPTNHTAAEPAHCEDGNGLNDDLGCEGEDEAEGTDLNTFAGVLGNQSGQGCVSNVISGEEDCIQQGVGQEEENVLCGLTPAGGNGEAGYQGDGAANVGPQHPGAGLTHLGLGLVDHSSEEEVGNTVEYLRKCDQCTDNTHAHANGVGQVDHHECGQQCVYAVAGNVAGAVADLMVPLQIFLFLHNNAPLHHFVGLIISVRG